MAEFIFKALARAQGLEGEYYVESAAVSREEIGNHIYPPARRCLSQHGVPFDVDKTARQVTKADYERFDRLVCMDSSNVRRLRDIVGGDPQKKFVRLLDFLPDDDPRHGKDVADPWYTGKFDATYRDIVAGCRGLLSKLEGEH